MKRESNFYYVQGTDIEECYNKLKMAELVYNSFPDGTKMSLRAVAETILINIKDRLNIQLEKSHNSGIYYEIMCKLINDSRIDFSKIYNQFNYIRVNGNSVMHSEVKIKEESKKQPIELLKIIHKLILWYLQDITNQIPKNKEIEFIEPTNFNTEKKELDDVRKNILVKNNEIDKLKSKIKLLMDSEKDKSKELNKLIKEINNINDEKFKLKEKDNLLEKKIKEHDKKIEDIKRKYKVEFEEKIEQFKKEHRESEKASNEAELAVIKNEIIKKNNEINELKNTINNLEEKSKEKLELQKIIKKIDVEKEILESRDLFLTKEIKEYNIKLKKIEEQYQRDLGYQINQLKSKEDIYLNEKEELNKIRQKIDSKDNEINELKVKIDDLEQQLKEINLLNISIDQLQNEKRNLENSDRILNNKIFEKDKELLKIKEDYKSYEQKIELLRKERNESNESLKNKETKLIKVEKENWELKKLISELEKIAQIEAVKKDEEIKVKEKELQQELEKVRQSYKNSFELTRKYQDDLEKSEYVNDEDEEKLLNLQRVDIKKKLVQEDNSFYDNLNQYTKSAKETNQRIQIFKKVLNEKSIKNGKYVAFYRGFLGLEGEQLRILYTMITKINISSILINKSKELISQSNEDKFMKYINEKAKELNNLSDDEIRLKIYYRLINLTNIEYRNICERKSFVETLDDIVDAGYLVLKRKNNFTHGYSKIEAIVIYYLEKILNDLQNKYNSGNIEIQEELIDNIYNNFRRLNEETIKDIYSQLHVKNISESKIKEAIRLDPFVFLITILSSGGFSAFSTVSNVIFDISHLLGITFSFGVYAGTSSLLSFFSGPFMVILFIVNGGFLLTQHKKQQLELVPLFIMQTIITNVAIEQTKINFNNYDTMIELWKKEKGNFDAITLQKRMQEGILNSLTKERNELEATSEHISKAVYTLWEEHEKYTYKFKNTVLSSDKKVYLNSYSKYSSTINKVEMAKKEIDYAKNNIGTLKSIFSLDMWKEQSSKILSEINLTNIEKELIKEAKQSEYFIEESELFFELEKKIDTLNSIQNRNREKIKDKSNLMSVCRNKITLIEENLLEIKSEYPDFIII